MDKKKLAQGLSQTATPPIIKRGAGVRLSTDPVADTPHDEQRTNALATIQRVNRGYKLREDLIKACKTLANDTDRNLYEVMEAALVHYLTEQAPDLLERYSSKNDG
jgi:hypothetical protein